MSERIFMARRRYENRFRDMWLKGTACSVFAAMALRTAGLGVQAAPAARAVSQAEKPYWLLVVAVSFFIAVTTGVIVVLTYQKKVGRRPADAAKPARPAEHGLTLKTLTQEDIGECGEILAAVYGSEPQRWELETAENYLRDCFEAPKFVGFVLKIDGRVCGAVFCRKRVWRPGGELFIDEMFVRPELQRKGYGALLMAEAGRYAAAHGLAGLGLAVRPDTPAADFCRKNGFNHCRQVLFMSRKTEETRET